MFLICLLLCSYSHGVMLSCQLSEQLWDWLLVWSNRYSSTFKSVKMVLWGIHGFTIQIKNNSCFLSFPGLSAVSAMPLFSWMKWSQDSRVQAQDEGTPLKTSGVVPSRMLIRELLWHVEERERLARELEREHRLAHSALGLHWFQKYPRLRTLIPTSELHQLEFLCAQIPPIHAATILSRCLEAAMPCSVLTLVSCQQWLAATASTHGLTAGKAE